MTAALAEISEASEESLHVVYWIHLQQQTNPFLEGYVGVTSDLERRWGRHKRNVDVLPTKRNGFPLYAAFRKHGLDSLQFEVWARGLDKWSAHNLEYALRPHAHIGYNLQVGGYWRSCLICGTLSPKLQSPAGRLLIARRIEEVVTYQRVASTSSTPPSADVGVER